MRFLFWGVYYEEESEIIDECVVINWFRNMVGKKGGVCFFRILVL